MSYQHKSLAAGRWRQLKLIEQMAHIAGEVERSLNWKGKNNSLYSQAALDRAFELLDLTIEDNKNRSRLKEIVRVREALADFFWGENQYGSNAASWQKYFACFSYAARKDK